MSEPAVRIQLLSRVRAWRLGAEVDLGPNGPRTLLALLALADGRPVSRSEIAGALWGEQPPRQMANIIQNYAMRLRRQLEPDRRPRARGTVLVGVGDGYALHLPAGALDVEVFCRLLDEADAARGDRQPAHPAIARALTIWAGAPADDLPQLAAHARVTDLVRRWRDAVLGYAEDMVRLGTPDRALPALQQAARTDPLDEALHGVLVRAYHHAGRRRDAVLAYRAIESRLADELNLTPGSALREAYADIGGSTAAGHGAPAAPARPTAAGRLTAAVAPGRLTAAAELPVGCGTLAGRTDERRRLDEFIDGAGAQMRRDGAIVCIEGGAGVGKTALALHWGRTLAPRFPDGRLYLDLCGYGSRPPVDPADALCVLVGLLSVTGAGTSRRVPLSGYHALFAGRRILLVLDNVRDAEQVLPLLPGAPGCLVLLTSRRRLTSLTVTHAARRLRLGCLPTADAHELLRTRIGAARLAAEPSAAGEIVDSCDRLPLALAIAAAYTTERDDRSLASVADHLADPSTRLDALDLGDDSTGLRAALAPSYAALTSSAAGLFRLLGLHPTGRFTDEAAASLAAGNVRAALTELGELHLVTEGHRGRFQLAGHVWRYAAEQAHRHDSVEIRAAALGRLLRHMVDAATRSACALRRTDQHAAGAWFDAEHDTLAAAVALAGASDRHEDACRIAQALWHYLARHGRWEMLVRVQADAAASSAHLADLRLRGRTQRDCHLGHVRLGRPELAASYLDRAEALFRAAEDEVGVAEVATARARMHLAVGRDAQALIAARFASEVLDKSEHDESADALSLLAVVHARLGRRADALACGARAVSLRQRQQAPFDEAVAVCRLGVAHHDMGDYEEAAARFELAVAGFRQLNVPYRAAAALLRLGDAHLGRGDRGAATTAWRESLRMLTALGHPQARDARVRLRPGAE